MLTLSAPHGGHHGHHHHHGGGGHHYHGGSYGPRYVWPNVAPEVIVVQADCIRDPDDRLRCCPPERIANGQCFPKSLRGLGETAHPSRFALPAFALAGLAAFLYARRKRRRR